MARVCRCGACRLCQLHATRADYRRAIDGRAGCAGRRAAAAGVTAAAPAPPCVHYVDAPKLRGPDAPDRLRDWRLCPKGHGAGGAVCPCRGCGPACPDFEPDAPAA